MMEPQIIQYPSTEERFGLKIALRSDYYDFFRKVLQRFLEESDCSLFHHNVIKNYRKKGHIISTFGNHEKWHNVYWHQYCWDDPSEQMVHKDNVSMLSMNILEPDNRCSEERLKVCHVKSGFSVSINYEDDIKETMVFGWKDFKIESLNPEKVERICRTLAPIRNFHKERGLEIFS